MPWVVARMRADDYERWARAVHDYDDHRREAGCKSYHLLRHADDPQDVIVLTEWDNLDDARRWNASQPLQEGVERSAAQDRALYFSEA